jgi:hypothetical protein
MPKFKVCVQQYVEEIASIWIVADTPEKAVALAEQELADGNVDAWHDGDDIKDRDVYAVLDASGNSVWER